MPSDRPTLHAAFARALRQTLPWVLALAVATCSDDQTGPSRGGTGYFAFRPVYGINGSLSQFGIVADSVHVRLTRPVDQVVLDTTVFFPADSAQLHLALPVLLQQSPETLTAIIGISSGPTLLFTDSLDVSVVDGPPSVANIPTAILTYVGPGKNVAAITLAPADTTIVLGDTLFFSATAVDSSAAPVSAFFVGWKTSDTTVAKINGNGRLIAPKLRGSVQVIGTTPTGIADTTLVTFAPVPTQIVADSGDAQTGTVPDSLGALFVARVLGADNLGISGIAVRWTAVTAGGAVRDTLLYTDLNGRVRTRGVLGDTVRAYSYSAAVVGKPLSVTFTAAATAAAPSAIAFLSGNGQTDSAGRALAAPFVAQVTDAYGNVASGAKVYWTRTAGHGTVSSDSTLTDASGLATITYTLGAVGSDTVIALLGGTSSQTTFTATTINGKPATVTKTVGDTQSALVGQALAESLAVVVKSATNFPVVGSPVVWTVLRGGLPSADTTLTDVNGRAAVAYTLGTVSGTDSVQASAGSVTSTFTAVAQAAAPSAIAILSGDGQVDTTGRTLAQPLVVAVTDTFGNPVLGAPVTFVRTAGTGTPGADTVTSVADNHPGVSYTLGALPGTDSIRATLVANGAFVTFTATAVPALPAAVITLSGDSQTVVVGTESTDTIVVAVRDAANHPVAGVNVDWIVVPAVGGLTVLNPTGVQRTVSDSLGIARAVRTAGTVAQTVRIEAQAGAVIDSIWTFQVAAAPSAIAVVSGDAQVDTTGRTLPQPLTVHVTDALGNAIAGAKVGWQTVHGSGAPVTDTTLTDAAGNTSTTYTLGAVPGTDTVRATLSGSGASVDFTEGTVSALPAGIFKLLGDNQVDTVLATLTDSLVVQLKDGSNNPIPNAWLYWLGAGITLSVDSTKTDATGRAAVQATFGSAAAGLVVAVRNADTTVAAVFNLRAKAGVPTQLNLIGGDLQSAPINTALAQPFRVFAQDAHGNPADSVRVAFTRLAGAGVVTPDTATADSLGFATAQYTLGSVARTDTVEARLVGGTATVTFQATATSGAAASLAYSGGTGQSDTVHATLTSPFAVTVHDAGSNPVAGVWVHFTRIRGNGTVLSDSNVTDVLGTAATGYTLGTAAGLDSVIATLPGTPDTVAFYALTNVGAAQSIAIVAGDSQSAAVSTALAAPLAVRVTDQFANPIAGATVTFDTTATGGSVAGATTVTDATGLATSGTVTLGAAAGTATFIATTPALPADTARFTAVALPIGTSAQWTGALSSTWGSAGNWSPAAIPSSADNVFIPASAPNQPVLDAARSIGGLQVESGATLALGANSLTTVGNTQVDGTLTRTSGLLILAASSGTARGALAGVRVTGNITLNGATTVADSLQLTSGSLVVGGQTLTINGAFSNNGSGAFTMQNAADSVTVTGATVYNGTAAAGLLSAGTLVFQGGFSEPSGSAVFQASGSHTTVFAGGASQTVTFAAASLAGNHFQNLTIDDPSGITLGGNIAAAGDVLVNAGVVTGAGRTATLGGGLLDPTSTGWNVGTTSVAGVAGFFPDTILGNLDVTGTLPLLKALVVKGNYTQSSGTLNPDGFSLRIEGSTTVSGTASFLMQSPSDSVDLVGAASWNGSTAAGLLNRGTLVLRNNLSIPSGSAVFQASGTHTTIFAGSAVQTVNVAAAGPNFFNDLVVANPAGVQLLSNIATVGRATITAGTLTGAHTALIGTGVADPTNVSWLPDMTEFTGAVAVLPDSLGKGVTVSGGIGLLKPLVVKGPVSVINSGTFDLNGFSARFDSTLTVSGSAQFQMMNPADSLDVGGTVTWNGSTATGLLGSGTLVLRGNLSVPTGSAAFQPNGTHRTILAGGALQTVNFGGTGPTGNRFNHFTAANPAGVSFLSNVAITGDASVTAGTVIATGHTLFVNGNLTDPTGVAWQPDVTELDGTPTVLPDSFVKGLTINGTVTLGHGLAVQGPVSVTNNGVFTLNGFRARVDSTFTVTGNGQVLMQNTADTLDVAGLSTWNGSTTTGLLTAGTLILRGDFSEPSGSTTFSATGTHVTLFAGSVAQSAAFGAQGLASNHFQDLVVANAAGVNFTNGAAVSGDAAIAGGVVTTSAGRVVTVAGNVTDATNISWRPETTSLTGTPTVLPDSFPRNVTVSGTVTLSHSVTFKANLAATAGAFALNGFHVRVDSTLNVSGSAQLLMQNAADTLDVAGLATWNGSTTGGLLTAGTLILRGDFSEPSGSSVFAASGTHATVLAGAAAQSLSFGAPGLAANHFQDLVVANAAGANFTSSAAIAGNATVSGGVLTTNAGQTVTVAGNVADPTGTSWRPETTALTGTPTVLPDSFTRNVTVSGTVTLPHAMAFRANLAQTAGTIAVNGFTLRVDSALSISGGAFQMTNAADSVDVAGTATWNGSTAAGLLTAGTLVLRGDFSEPSGSPVFQAGGTHTTVFAGAAAHTVTFGAPGAAANRFNGVTLAGPGGLVLGSSVNVNGTFAKPAGAPVTVGSSAALRVLTVRGLAVDGVVFDSVRVAKSGPATTLFDNVTFQRQDPTTTQLTLVEPGTAAAVKFTNVQFLTTPTTGKLVSLADTAADGNAAHVGFYHSVPLDGAAFETQVAGADGASIDWSSFAFTAQPLGVAAGATLAPVTVAVLGPDAAPDTLFTGSVALAFGANPGGATLGGTNPVAAVAGVATFGDLTVDNAGIGYTLVATTAGIGADTSNTFDITVLLPVGFTSQWLGTTSTDWNTASNWSTGTVPDSTTNVFISGVGSFAPSVQSGTGHVNRLRIATGATVDIASGDTLVADSTVEAGTTVTGSGILVLRGTGTLSGTVNVLTLVDGAYDVAGSATLATLTIQGTGALTVAADTLTVQSDLNIGFSGTLAMNDPAALVDVGGNANFSGGSTAGLLAAGTLRLAGDLIAGGSSPTTAFMPSGALLTVLNGPGNQLVNFIAPDSVNGSHFGRLQVSTAGTAAMLGRYDAMGDLLITTGATLHDSGGLGFEEHGFTTIDAGGTLAVRDFRTRGGIGAAVGATYSVPTTTYYGGGAFPINPAPYDTLVLELQGQATGDFAISGDLRLTGAGAGFDPNGHTVSVGGDVDINNGATLTMQNAADVLNVAGSFFTNGDSTVGRLTDGLLQIAGSFHQSADLSGESFRASGNHTTRFTGGAGLRQIKFDSPSQDPTDLGGSHFAILDLPDGVDTMAGRVPAAVSVSVGASVTFDTLGGGNELASYGPLSILASSDSVHLQGLETWGGLSKAGTGTFAVGNTRLWGGSGVLPALPYIDLSIAHTTYTLGADQVIAGNLSLGIFCSEVCTSSPGELVVGGHVLTVGADLGVLGLGQLTMGAGDSVDVTGTNTWRGAPNSGHLTGGTLVVRGLFNEVGTDVFQADAAHRTVLLNPGTDDIYLASNSWFGKLYLLGGPRRIRTSAPLVAVDSLVLGSSTAALSDTAFGANDGQLVTHGPIFTVAGSEITLGGSMQIDVSAPQIFGSYTVANTILGGTGQTVPNLTYGNGNIRVIGTAQLGTPVDIGSGTFTVDGSAGTAGLALNSHMLQVGDFATTGDGTLSMTAASDTLVVRGAATFAGGDETGKLTAGTSIIRGAFTQTSPTSPASFYASGTHKTVFADSTATVAATTSGGSMANGASRFNDVEVLGRGVVFDATAWIGGNTVVTEALDSVGGPALILGGALSDTSHKWRPQTTYLQRAPGAALPDTLMKDVVWSSALDTLKADLVVLGSATVQGGTLVVNGHALHAAGNFATTLTGALDMTNPADQVTVDGLAQWSGASEQDLLTAGRLTLKGNFLRDTVPTSFTATGTHVTVLAGSALQTLTNQGPMVYGGYGFQELVALNPNLNIDRGIQVLGTFRDSVAGMLTITGTPAPAPVYLLAGQVEITDAQFQDVKLAMGDQSQLDQTSFSFTSAAGEQQLTIQGPGRATPLDLHDITFNNWADAGTTLVIVSDDKPNGDSLHVRMFGSTPFDGSTVTLSNSPTGDGADVKWSHLALGAPLPVTVDSAVPFDLQVVVKEPDGSNRANVVGIPTIALAANPAGATLGVGSISAFDGQVANINGLTLDKSGAGVSFLIAMQGRAIDSLTTGTLDVLNPAPVGAIVWDGSAGNGLWSDTMNWSSGTTPTAGDSVFIGAGQSVTFNTTTTIGGLVLGQGATLDLQGDLTVTGRVAAGNTITSASSALILQGTNVQVSGSLPRTTVVGTAVATGPITVAGDLMIDSAGGGLGIASEFTLNGHPVIVNGSLWTRNGGLFTMTSPADTLTIDGGSFSGGDETGHLTDGVLYIKSSFDQVGGDPNSFHTSGNHTTVYPNTGTSAFVDISDPGSSQFANLRIENPFGVDLNESGAGWVRVTGNFTIDSGGVATGDSVIVGGNVTLTAPGDSVDLALVRVSGALSAAGGYNVPVTELATGATITGTPAGYQALTFIGNAALSGPVTARSATVVAGGALNVNGHPLTVDSLFTDAGLGDLVMDAAADTVVVNTLAEFTGTTPATPMTAGYLEIRGDLNVLPNWNAFVAGPGHVTRFAGAPVHLMNFPGEGNATPLGTVVIDSGTVLFNDPSLITGDLILHDGLLADSNLSAGIVVQGSVHGDNGPATELLLGRLTVLGTLDWQGTGAHYEPAITEFAGTGQVIPQLQYQQVDVKGIASLGADQTWAQGTVDSAGVLTLGGHRLDISTNGLLVTDSARLVMQDPLDSLAVAGTAIFSTDANTLGDYTAGGIRARHFEQVQGSFGGTTSFVQSGSNRIVPQAGDTIEMTSGGPAGSMLKTLVLNGTGGPVYTTGPSLWIADSLVITGGADSLVGAPGSHVIVGFPGGNVGTIAVDAGTIAVDTLGVAGPLSVNTGIYAVALTKFLGAGQTIPTGVAYQDIEVQYAAALGGDLSLPDRHFTVTNSGVFDLNGHQLTLAGLGGGARFETQGLGVLVMGDPADLLSASNVKFGGGDETGKLTDGLLQVGNFQQQNSSTINTFVASGNHTTEFINIGFAPEGGFNLQMDPDQADTASHFNNVSFLGTNGVHLSSGFYAAGALSINNTLNGGSYTVAAAGPISIGSAADVTLDTLRVLGTLTVDPSATYTVTNTVFGPSAAPIPAAVPYNSVFIEGTQTLSDTLTASGDIHVLKSGVLTPNGSTVRAGVSLFLQDNARLVMATNDTVDAGQARFDGAASGSDLAGGLLRLRTGLVSTSNSGGQTFAPSGMVTEFYGGGTANISMANAGQSWSYFDSLRVIGATTIAPEAEFYVRGHALFMDGSTFDGNSSGSALVFAGKMSVLDSSKVEDVVANTIFFYDSLIAAPTATYNVQNTRFDNTNGIPDLPYQYLTLGDGVHDTLTHPLTASGQLILSASGPGTQDLVLHGQKVTTADFSVGGYARFTMDSIADTMEVAGPVLFGGADQTGRLTAGVLRVGGDFTQNSATSVLSFVSSGTRTEFYGNATHAVTFANTAPGLSHFADLAVLDGGKLQPHSSLTAMGGMTVDTSSTFDGLFLGSGTAEFFGKVNVLDLGQVNVNNNFNTMFFHDSLIVAPTGSYSGFNSIFQGTDGIPNAGYTHMYLRQGVHLTLTHPLFMTGGLNIQNDPGSGGTASDTVTIRLNGHKVSANGLGIVGYGRITMDSVSDTLEVFQDATWRGVDQDTSLTKGVIRIGRGFAQNGQFSARSYAPAGTRTEFYGSLTHQASFTNSGIGESHFADLAVVDVSTLSPLTMFNVTGTTNIGPTAHFDGAGIPLGSVVDFHGVVTVQSGGDFHAAASPAFFNFYGNGGLDVQNGASVPYDVLNTGFVTNNAIPDLPYKNLYLAGTDSVISNNVTADSITITDSTYVGSGVTLHANLDMVVDGSSIAAKGVLTIDSGTLQVDSTFTTQNAGYLVSRSLENSMTIHNAYFNGGPETVNLTAGQLNVTGNFVSGIGTSFDSDSLFVVNFTGGGFHDLTLGNSGSQNFGELRVSSSLPGADTLNLSFAGTLNAYRFATIGSPRIQGSANVLQTQQLGVNGATFDHVTVHESTFSPQPMQFDDVTFTGFSSTDVQLWIDHPGTGILNPTQFINVDFDDAAAPDGTTGFFVKANDSDGVSTFLNLEIYGPDSGIGATLTDLLNGALVGWFPPS